MDSVFNKRIAVVGLGYVGLPLAVRLGNHFEVIGFDINEQRISELLKNHDRNNEVSSEDFLSSRCSYTNDVNLIRNCNVYIITVPTPIDSNSNPDLEPVRSATRSVAKCLKEADIVVYESTVYPGITENICGKILEDVSGLKSGVDFFLGYSPERINPGDKVHTVDKITKVVAGQTSEVTDLLAHIYGTVTNHNVFRAKDIRTAEAAKAIENAQRDINIAFINEVTIIINKLGLSVYDVLEAAQTKWNFLRFSPGLVGGHCIGVDPFYLAECAKNLGHNPAVILSGRAINDSMALYVAERIHKAIYETSDLKPKKKNILVLGFTFKENINDVRNTKIADVAKHLLELGYNITLHDPYADQNEVRHEYNLDVLNIIPLGTTFDCVALLVPHKIYLDMNVQDIQTFIGSNTVVFDLKHAWATHGIVPILDDRYITL